MISKIISELDNFDWVKTGFEKYCSSDICPFCQQKTLDNNLKDEFKKYFDKTYSDKIDIIKSLLESYENEISNFDIKNQILENKFIQIEKDKFENLYNELLNLLNQNLEYIKNKLSKPNTEIKILTSKDKFENINKFIDKINEKIIKYNDDINNKSNLKQDTKDKFLKLLRVYIDSEIVGFQENEITFNTDKKEFETQKDQFETQKLEQYEIIRVNQEKTINIENAIDKINENLNFLGLIDFKIEKYEDGFYKITRDDFENCFKTLSEGKKTIISFLYFMELCLGAENGDEVTTKKIIVIDDPISSLSHNYIFSVATMIKDRFFNNNFEQIFILTHNLYFFHEILYSQKSIAKFRVFKNNQNYSKIENLDKNVILNDYQSYWQLIDDCINGKAHKSLLPNAMRNILEHFFGFLTNHNLNQNNYHEIISGLDKQKYNAFIRYINRESHSDLVNLSDMKEIDEKIFLEAFKNVFELAGFLDHYKAMMKIQ